MLKLEEREQKQEIFDALRANDLVKAEKLVRKFFSHPNIILKDLCSDKEQGEWNESCLAFHLLWVGWLEPFAGVKNQDAKIFGLMQPHIDAAKKLFFLLLDKGLDTHLKDGLTWLTLLQGAYLFPKNPDANLLAALKKEDAGNKKNRAGLKDVSEDKTPLMQASDDFPVHDFLRCRTRKGEWIFSEESQLLARRDEILSTLISPDVFRIPYVPVPKENGKASLFTRIFCCFGRKKPTVKPAKPSAVTLELEKPDSHNPITEREFRG